MTHAEQLAAIRRGTPRVVTAIATGRVYIAALQADVTEPDRAQRIEQMQTWIDGLIGTLAEGDQLEASGGQ